MKTKFMAILVAAVAAAGTRRRRRSAARSGASTITRHRPSTTGPVSTPALTSGYEWGKVTNFSGDPSGIAGGGQLGYNWQVGQFVFGAETDIQVSGADDTFAPWKFSNPWFGTLCGRAG